MSMIVHVHYPFEMLPQVSQQADFAEAVQEAVINILTCDGYTFGDRTERRTNVTIVLLPFEPEQVLADVTVILKIHAVSDPERMWNMEDRLRELGETLCSAIPLDYRPQGATAKLFKIMFIPVIRGYMVSVG